MSFGDIEVVHEPQDILGHVRAVALWVIRLVAFSVPATVQGDHPVVSGQRIENIPTIPTFQVPGEAVH